jgi:hypothetical protein
MSPFGDPPVPPPTYEADGSPTIRYAVTVPTAERRSGTESP